MVNKTGKANAAPLFLTRPPEEIKGNKNLLKTYNKVSKSAATILTAIGTEIEKYDEYEVKLDLINSVLGNIFYLTDMSNMDDVSFSKMLLYIKQAVRGESKVPDVMYR